MDDLDRYERIKRSLEYHHHQQQPQHIKNNRDNGFQLIKVENEYGSYGSDKEYLNYLQALYIKYLGAGLGQDDGVVFYSTDGGESTTYLYGSQIDDGGSMVFQTVDFGPEQDVNQMFATQRVFEPTGPLMNSEYYTGWLTHWTEPTAANVAPSVVAQGLTNILPSASVNMYMLYGGSNYGYMNGANGGGPSFDITIQSYDYDAPISEWGGVSSNSKYQSNALGIDELHDRATIFLDNEYQGTLQRPYNSTLSLNFGAGTNEIMQLSILLENQGRINYGSSMLDRKGLGKGVLSGSQYLGPWTNILLPLADAYQLNTTLRWTPIDQYNQQQYTTPSFYLATFQVENIAETFLSFQGLGKGQLFVNGFNVGRYWNVGPQQTIYIPSVLLYQVQL
ncbi:glycoside hydrolase family 35 protein [Cavenderia fasciculata]|uniref:Glycoside hydrolase family 35 protein n=1 Tax=Cavenderia fasciculata TaxID=261658 RepID=F4PJY1_CACFS|nr:glycoside hydrolase family 35 protein [Cavenderia fasciculata]EGG23905.1 glycoside hydrolase family 35 protein [Cavenderia fasciculata]|eukprot:XP_004361756.1 glycoside hydrolase family 35 protein [Cavenderia fasciculata]